MSGSSDEEGEYVRKNITVTRSGRRSVPPLRQETDRVRTDRRQNTQRQNTRRRNRQTTVNMGGVNLTGQQVTELLQNRSTTIIGTDSLPKFRGRKRQNDPQFEDQNSFRQHLSLVNNYISTLNNPTEQEKKQVLLRSADPHIGDFHLKMGTGKVNAQKNKGTLGEIVQGEIFPGEIFPDECKYS